MARPPRRLIRGIFIAALLVGLCGGVAVALDGSRPSEVLANGGAEAPRPGSGPPPAELPAAEPETLTTTVVPAVAADDPSTAGGDHTPAAPGASSGGPSTDPGAGRGHEAPVGSDGGVPPAPGPPPLVPATANGPMPPGPLTVDGLTDGGPARRVAQGFLHGLLPEGDGDGVLPLDAVNRLRPTSWRLSVRQHGSEATAEWREFNWARAAGADLTYLVIDTWYHDQQIQDPLRRGLCARAGIRGMANSEPPWAGDWRTFRAWLRDYVEELDRNDQLPTYWEPFNEAVYGTFNACDAFTVQRQLQVWRVTYDVIRSIVPDAKIIGPSTGRWLARPDPDAPDVLDATTFLNYVVGNGLDLAALNWHEIGTGEVTAAPATVAAHVREAREMLDRRGLTTTLVTVNEYLSQPRNMIPGWIVGYIGAFESAGADHASRTCWPGNGDDYCYFQTVDGLFSRDGDTNAPYWVHRFYGDMDGTRVDAASTDPDVTAFAVRDDTAGVLRVLVGRHAGCAGTVRLGCPALPIPAIDTTLTVRAPWTIDRYRVVVNRISPSAGPVAADDLPVVADTVLSTDDGLLHLELPEVADGDAVTITITAA